MPTYDYKCKNCSHLFEEFQSMKAESLVECPSCHTPNLVRIIGMGAGMIFKGSGFYHTDYKNSGASEKSSESSPASEKKPDVKQDQKAETKTTESAPSEKKSETPAPKSDQQ